MFYKHFLFLLLCYIVCMCVCIINRKIKPFKDTDMVPCLQIKKDYYEEKINAGPQSKILEGMTWEEAEKMKVGLNKQITCSAFFCKVISHWLKYNHMVY